MSSSVTDAINLAASVITLLGAGVTVVGFIRKLVTPRPRPQGRTQPPIQGHQASNTPHGGYPYPGPYPTAPIVGAPMPVNTRRVPHPVILSLSAIAVVCVVGYSLVLLVQFAQTGSTGIPDGSPLIAVNAVLIAGNLIFGCAAEIGQIIAASRARMTGWLVSGAIGLAVIVFTLGIFSILALAPTVYYSLFGSTAWRPRRMQKA